jgi:hypothetical protein
MRNALIVSLFKAWASFDAETSAFFVACALALYRRGASLLEADIARLKHSFADDKLSHLNLNYLRPSPLPQYDCYVRRIPYFSNDGEKLAARHSYSHLMLVLPWFNQFSLRFQCSWILRAKPEDTLLVGATLIDPDIVLVCKDGGRFLVHNEVVSNASDKLAAAIRFAEMSRANTGENTRPGGGSFELDVDMPTQCCRWLLEHIYHGSIAGGLSNDAGECCYELLELLLIAEEFLCKSLAQECEMRLLSSADTCNICFCSYCSASVGMIATVQEQEQTVECRIRVCGPSMIDAHSALDVLAVAQHVSGSFSESDYTVRKTLCTSQLPHICSPMIHLDCIVRQPLKALLEVTVQIILSKFHGVVQSPSFGLHFGDQMSGDKTDYQHVQESLLRSCLKDFHGFCLSEPIKPVDAMPDLLVGVHRED